MKEQYNKLIKISIWSSIVLFAIRCSFSWQTIILSVSAYDLFGYAGEAVGIAAILTTLYEKWIWRINPLDKTPKLHKKYSGILKSTYDNKERKVQLEINQSLLSIQVTLISEESKSKSISASIDVVSGEPQLTYCYLNTPKSEFRHKSQIHYGSAALSITDTANLSGQYFTDRKTTGDMNFTAH